MKTDDMSLLQEYARNGSEEAFATLVSRHVGLVYSVAIRQIHDAHLAEEVTQTAFIILARKASSLKSNTILSAWLCRTAQYAISDIRKIQNRRQRREREIHMESLISETEPEEAAWAAIVPMLDTALAGLGEKDHSAIVLRYFEGKDLKQVGAALGVSENAAKTRVSRATEKLRKFFIRNGVTLPSAVIVGGLLSNSVQAAPLGLASSVTVATLKGTGVTVSTLTLIQTTLKIMTYAKIKTTVVISIISLLLAGTTVIVIEKVSAQSNVSQTPSKQTLFVQAGYDTPEAAYKTWLWALSTGSLETAATACTPEQAGRLKERLKGKTVEQMRQAMAEAAENMVHYQVSQKEVISENEVRLLLLVEPFPGHPNAGNDLQVMQKIGSKWKYAGKYGVDIKDR